MGTTPMFAPDGTIGDVPHAKIAEAVKAGFKIGVDMNAPDGSKGTIPVERIHDAIKGGFSPFVPTEAQAAQSPIVAPVPLPGAGQQIMGGTFPSELDPSKKYDEPMGQPVLPVAGLSVPQVIGGIAGNIGGQKLGEYIGEKSKLSPYETMWAGRIGSVLGSFAGAGGGAQVESLWTGLKQSFASKLYTAEGELTEAGKGLVHPTKLPEIALRKIIPPPQEPGIGAPLPSSAEFYENRGAMLAQRTGNPETEGQQAGGTGAPLPSAAEHYENRAAMLAQRTGNPETEGQQGGGAGGQLPSAAEYYQGKAADLAKRGKEQATLDRAAARSTKLGKSITIQAGQGSSSSPAGVQGAPNVSLPAVSGEAAAMTGPPAAINAPPETPSAIVPPGSKPTPIKGSFWSYPEAELRKAVLSGDREAAVVYRMRYNTLPPGAKYLNDVSESIIKGLYQSAKEKP